jgi:hypothetical protein
MLLIAMAERAAERVANPTMSHCIEWWDESQEISSKIKARFCVVALAREIKPVFQP